jgi:hypothetical protein
MSFDLSEDQRAFQRIAKEFSIKELAPNAGEWDAKGEFPVETIKKAGDLGFCWVGLIRALLLNNSLLAVPAQRHL